MKVIKEITEQTQFTDPISCGLEGLTLLIGDSSSFSGTITVQIKTDDFTNWIDDSTYTVETIETINPSTEVSVRVGCDTGDYISGSIKVALYRGEV